MIQRAGVELLDLILRHGEIRLWANLSSSLALVQRTKGGNLRATFGPADWWKLHALYYMRRRSRPSCRTRDVRAYLAQLGLKISSLNRHDIRRDERAGSARKRE